MIGLGTRPFIRYNIRLITRSKFGKSNRFALAALGQESRQIFTAYPFSGKYQIKNCCKLNTMSTLESPYPEGSVAHKIFLKSTTELSPVQFIEVINESSGHSVPKGSETHFKVIVVSNKFQGLLPIQRHRVVYNILKPEMRNDSIPEDRTNFHKIHALSIIAKTESEWEQEKDRLLSLSSPQCRGGGKK